MRAFCSPHASYVTADPGFEGGLFAADRAGARVVKVPLTKTYAHDVKAMLAAAPDAGVFYICQPNNPTGTLTSRADIEYLVENKPKNSIVLVDEAYIHFSDAPSAIELVKAGKDVIVLRTFSKIYGMAGLRCGFAIARPELLDKLHNYGGYNFMPVTAVAAASASLKDAQLVAERKRTNEQVRAATFQWLDRNGYSYIPSVVELLSAGYQTSGKGSHRRHGAAERYHRAGVAGDAKLFAYHGGHQRRDGAIPGGVAEGDEGLKVSGGPLIRKSRMGAGTRLCHQKTPVVVAAQFLWPLCQEEQSVRASNCAQIKWQREPYHGL